MRFLITEDDRVTRRVLELFLSPYGQVDTVENGEDALNRFGKALDENKPYQLMCLDIGLPDQLGIDVLRKIRSIELERNVTPAIPVIMLTGAADDEHVAAARELGALEYLLKPVIESSLVAYLQKLQIIK